MRLAYYAGVSTAAAAACLLKAFHQRPNYYSATVYLSQSNACLLILTNLLLVIACSFIYGLQRLLYGPLRPIETEQLSEKAWYAVLDTLLAMPSFREEVGGWLLAMFTLLLAGKVWGWIGEGRVDILEQQPPANPRLFHLRLATSLIVSVVFDIWMLDFCVQTVLADPRPSMMVIFTFEFAILSVFSLFTLARYGLNVLGSRVEKQQIQKAIAERKEEIKAERAAARQNETASGSPAPADAPNEDPIEVDENEVDVPGWEEKRRYLFALEVFTDFIKLSIYIVFFTVSITFNGLPMHIMRDVYMTFASFSKRVGDFIAYRKATSDMNSRYPDATTEEIRGDACIVCRETMVAWEHPNAQEEAQPADEQPAAPRPSRRRDEGLRAKKLPCGHILHLRCLKAWLERQQVCPTCRRPVVTTETPAQPAQPGAPGPNPPPAGQPPQPQARRQNRARIFNLGPVRIGFLNGPGDQMNNIVRQIQNPNAAPGQNGDQQNQIQQQQGPNHLGLQQPYLPNGQGPEAHSAGVTGLAQARPSTSVQIQMMQVEQRLMEQAHALNIEQQQLGTLRAMEAELARLRAFHTRSAQTGISDTNSGHRQLQGLPAPLIPNMLDLPTVFPYPPMYQHLPEPATLHGSALQQMSNGQEHLPTGMVLPEGWTVMPLQRTEGIPVSEISAQIPQADSLLAQSVVPLPSQNSVGITNGTGSTNEPSTSNAQSTTGPTDDRGSPLFVPTNAQTVPVPAAPQTSNSDEAAAPTSSSVEGSQTAQQQQQQQQQQPWESNGWSFADASSGTAGNKSSVANGSASSSEGKGKGKAVEVEEVPDHGN